MASGALPDLWATPLAQYRLAKEPQYVSVRGNMMSERRSDPCGMRVMILARWSLRSYATYNSDIVPQPPF
jgi:hypothetical protein